MPLKKKSSFFLFFLVFGFGSCNKSGGNSIHPGVDVYIVGSGLSQTEQKGVGKIWKNEIVYDLQTSTVGYLGQVSEFTTDIAVSGNDIYVAGIGASGRNSVSGTNYNAKYWINGTPQNIATPGGVANASSIAVSGQDLFVAISDRQDDGRYQLARYWKNGVLITLSDSAVFASASGIAVSGSDVYVAGSNGGHAVYWKNGALVQLCVSGNASSIVVNGSDVYVSGTDSNRAVYWKNQVPTYLTDGSMQLSVGSIAVSGNDVWVAGNIYGTRGGYWKNAVWNLVEQNGSVSGISVLGNDVYVVGEGSSNNQPEPKFYINSKPVSLGNSDRCYLSAIRAVSH